MQRKRKLRQFHKEENRGSAMIVAIVVSMVVVVFCLSLLLVSYALFSSSVRRVTQNQCRELSKTISIEIEKELTTPAYISFDMQKFLVKTKSVEEMIQEMEEEILDEVLAEYPQLERYKRLDLSKAAGKVFEVEPAEAADIIVEKLKEKFII